MTKKEAEGNSEKTETVVTGDLVAEFVTDGQNYLSGLKPGEYIIHESLVPYGYKQATDKKISIYKTNDAGKIIDSDYTIIDKHYKANNTGVDLKGYMSIILVIASGLIIVLRVIRKKLIK